MVTEKKENNTLLAVGLASVLALCIGVNIGYLLGKGMDAEEVGQWFTALASGRDPREILVASEAEKFLQEITE